MQTLLKLDDETRERVLAWAAKKWPAKASSVASGPVTFSGDGSTKVR
jgi:hypothetical protein